MHYWELKAFGGMDRHHANGVDIARCCRQLPKLLFLVKNFKTTNMFEKGSFGILPATRAE
jgi:hypothetical protein